MPTRGPRVERARQRPSVRVSAGERTADSVESRSGIHRVTVSLPRPRRSAQEANGHAVALLPVPLAEVSSAPRHIDGHGPASRTAHGTPLLLVGVDLLVLALAEAAAVYLTPSAPTLLRESSLANLTLLVAPFPLIALASLAINGLYTRWSHQLLVNSFVDFRNIVNSLAVAGILSLASQLWWEHHGVQPGVEPLMLVIAVGLSLVAIPSGRGLCRMAAQHADSRRGIRVLVLGSGTVARQLLRYLSWDSRITLLGCVDDEPARGQEVLGGLDDLPRLCDELAVDQVLVSFSRTHPVAALDRLRALRPEVAVAIVPRYFELLSPRSSVRELAGLPVVEVSRGNLSTAARVAKRCFDIVGSVALLGLTAPVICAAALAVKVTSPGPILFRQRRVGRERRPFVIYKFRSMTVGTEECRGRSDADGPLFKMHRDPRVTRVGRLLRRTSIDELPQLLNVLKGDMSLVGPRPFVASEAQHIVGASERRFEVRPGLTGLWQVSGRSNLSFDDLLRLDYLYVASWSLWWDLRILWHTPREVMKGLGAY
jgi:exopolysaccharide biosynthesis polyprenyl glycosylphosphotransferase